MRVVLAVRGGLCRDYVQGLCRVQGVTAVAQHTVCAVTISCGVSTVVWNTWQDEALWTV